MEKEIFLVEELENRLAIEAVNYKHLLDEDWQNTKFDPMYFDTFISGELYSEFVQAIYDRIKPLNTLEATRFLTLSIAQFKTHTPARREQAFLLNYHNTYWFPNVVEFSIDENAEKYAKHVWKHYTNHFNTFKEATENALADYKVGTIANAAPAQKEVTTIAPKINNESLNLFLKALTYNYPYEYTALNFYYQMRDNLDYLKHEVLENLISLSKDERMPYLNKLKFDIGNNRQHSSITKDDIQVWLSKYNVESELEIGYAPNTSTLYRILDSPTPTIDEEFEPNFNRDTHTIQHEFYNYYYGYYIDLAVEFINEQLQMHNPNPIINTPSQSNNVSAAAAKPKLKTNLTVPQLAYLFKMLMDINPPIFDTKTKKEVYEFIEANFTTKGKEDSGPTVAKLNNLYSDVDKATAMFWATKLKKMLEDARKI